MGALQAAQAAQQAVKDLKADQKKEIDEMRQHVAAYEHSTETKLGGLESQMSTYYRDQMKTMTTPERILYYQALSNHGASRPLNGNNDSVLSLKDDATKEFLPFARPLLRRTND